MNQLPLHGGLWAHFLSRLLPARQKRAPAQNAFQISVDLALVSHCSLISQVTTNVTLAAGARWLHGSPSLIKILYSVFIQNK